MKAQTKTLSDLFQGYTVSGMPSESISISGISSDSRLIGRQGLFVAIEGFALDGHDFVSQAIQQGATVVVTQHPVSENSVPVLQVEDSRHALAYLARRFYECPDESLIMLGVTGTNGKTTVAYLLESIMNGCGLPCGLVGTVSYRWPGHEKTASHTTPDAMQLFGMLRQMVEDGVKTVSMEVSSHALALNRVFGIEYKAAIFTNLTRDHLDFHGNYKAYAAEKAKLLQQLAVDGVGIIYGDDPYAKLMAESCRGKSVQFGENAPDLDYQIHREAITDHGARFSLRHGSDQWTFETPLLGDFNVLNASAAVIAAMELGLNIPDIQKSLKGMNRIPGRMEGFRSKRGFWVVVDYAHTPDALENALNTARAFTKQRLITVFGCGGDRDKGKRPLMGRIAAEKSDRVIVTSDNPRTEDPQMIIEDILEGMPASAKMQVIEDRESAIREAIVQAQSGDTILIAGKGHEDYQILGTQKIHFDDREVAQKYINA